MTIRSAVDAVAARRACRAAATHAHVGVAVRLGDRLGDRLHHAGQRAVRHLVAGQLDRLGDAQLAGEVGGVAAGHVGGQRVQVGAGQPGHLLSSRIASVRCGVDAAAGSVPRSAARPPRSGRSCRAGLAQRLVEQRRQRSR